MLLPGLIKGGMEEPLAGPAAAHGSPDDRVGLAKVGVPAENDNFLE